VIIDRGGGNRNIADAVESADLRGEETRVTVTEKSNHRSARGVLSPGSSEEKGTRKGISIKLPAAVPPGVTLSSRTVPQSLGPKLDLKVQSGSQRNVRHFAGLGESHDMLMDIPSYI
jgi:hypothetical protein